MARNDDPDAGRTVAWGIVGAVFVFVLIVALQAVFYMSHEAEVRSKTYTIVPEELNRLVNQQTEEINSYGWVDPEARIARIPIERAMELIVLEHGEAVQRSLPEDDS